MPVMLQTAADEDQPVHGKSPGRVWVKGQSGNPNGRRGERKVDGKTLPELARSMTHDALKAIGRVLADPQTPPALLLQAADIVLRRGWGDAPKGTERSSESMTFVVQQLVVEPPPGGCPGVIRHPNPRWIDERHRQLGGTGEVVEMESPS